MPRQRNRSPAPRERPASVDRRFPGCIDLLLSSSIIKGGQTGDDVLYIVSSLIRAMASTVGGCVVLVWAVLGVLWGGSGLTQGVVKSATFRRFEGRQVTTGVISEVSFSKVQWLIYVLLNSLSGNLWLNSIFGICSVNFK